ncbi:MAG: PASTA domain-containing protein, partial [Clostridia bacterium]|nr:PASTA domain-containing protein [Clostridia bacterium]
KVPFEADNDSSVALMQLQEDAVRPSLINPSIPVGLEQITLRAMQKDPADRYQSAAEFLSDLYEFKRNPQIKFDYTYFVDSDPTKHIDVSADLKRNAEAASKTKPEPVPVSEPDDDEYDEEEDEDDDDDEEEERSVTVPFLIGIAIALILVIGAILLIAFGDQLHGKNNGNGTSSSESGESFWQKLDFLNLFASDKIEVPNFINMDFDEAREKYPNLAIDPEPQYVYNTTYESGKVIEQVPDAGDKVSPDTVIKLYVATNASMVQIPDVKSYNYKEAESILVAKGFTVELLQAFDETADEETVIYTDPNGSSYAAYGSKVYVYYASSSANALNGTRIPNVVGDQLSVAKQKILAAGLKVGAVTYNASSAALKNYVIGQNPVTGSQVTLGTYVNLVVGNGVTESSTSTYSITLPNTGAVGTVRTYLNGVPYNTYTNVLLNGSTFTVSFTGAGDANNFTVYVDSAKVASGSIDFSKPTGKLSDVSEYTYSARTAVPNVVGQTQDAAVKALKAAGFNNVSVQNVISNDVPAGKVVSQTPVSSTLTEYATSVTVVIYVSIGSSTPSSLAPSTTAAPPTVTMPPITEPPTQPTEPSEVTTEPVSGDEPSGDMYANGY